MDPAPVSSHTQGRGRGRGRGRGLHSIPSNSDATSSSVQDDVITIRGRGRGRASRGAHTRTIAPPPPTALRVDAPEFIPPQVLASGSVAYNPPARHSRAKLHQPTSVAANAAASSSALTDPQFAPSIAVNIKPKVAKQRNNNNNKAAKSIVPGDQARTDELVAELLENTYECMVCYSLVERKDPVWSCQECSNIFHLPCVKGWIRESATGEDKVWRCPACNFNHTVHPTVYKCYCGKMKNPVNDIRFLPHSCGEVCNNKRDVCGHRCTTLCHPGPCPPCSLVVQLKCHCGRQRIPTQCRNSGSPYSCGKICDKLLNCKVHKCVLPCHEGDCGVCEIIYTDHCYCGNTEGTVKCGERNREEGMKGTFACEQKCGKPLPCKNCSCTMRCHSGSCGSCPKDVHTVRTCPCGKMSLSLLSAHSRTSCTDPVPLCRDICQKHMPCGHPCPNQCHEGPCGPCSGDVTLICRCRSSEITLKCVELNLRVAREGPYEYRCDKLCNDIQSCGRHRCNERCCPAYGGMPVRGGAEDPHLCARPCGKKLKCGIHTCMETCHKGHCKPCILAGFEELSCHCGMTTLLPPIKCGTPPPHCTHPCSRIQDCDHPVKHQCHPEPPCPPCTIMVKRECVGRHGLFSKQCHIKEFSCGLPCGKVMACNDHICPQLCHKGSCALDGSACQQICGKKRRLCDHTCEAVCHPGSPCPDVPCRRLVPIKCRCKRRDGQGLCYMGGPDGYSNLSSVELAALLQNTQNSQEVALIFSVDRNRRLECDDQCAIAERNRRFAEALQIDFAIKEMEKNNDYIAPSFPEPLLDAARRDIAFVRQVEAYFMDLLSGHRVQMMLPIMKSPARQIVHQLAEVYGIYAESVDPEPKRSVQLTRRPTSKAPSILLSVFVTGSRASNGPSTNKVPLVSAPLSAPASVSTTVPISISPAPAVVVAKSSASISAGGDDVPDSWEDGFETPEPTTVIRNPLDGEDRKTNNDDNDDQ